MIVYAKDEIDLASYEFPTKRTSIWQMTPHGMRPISIKIPAGSPLVVENRNVNGKGIHPKSRTWDVLWFNKDQNEWVQLRVYDSEVTIEKGEPK